MSINVQRSLYRPSRLQTATLAYLWRLTGNLHATAWNAHAVAEETGCSLRQVQAMNTNHAWGARYEDRTPGVIW